jgi:hypothetical protein
MITMCLIGEPPALNVLHGKTPGSPAGTPASGTRSALDEQPTSAASSTAPKVLIARGYGAAIVRIWSIHFSICVWLGGSPLGSALGREKITPSIGFPSSW